MFSSSEIGVTGDDIFFCDLDGDGLKDAVLIDRTNVLVCFQDPKQGFPRLPQLHFSAGSRPALLWPAKLGRQTSSLLLMTSDGVSALDFSDHTNPPVPQKIISQPTVVPEAMNHVWNKCFPLSAATGSDWPLLLVPVVGGLQVWQHQNGWHQVQFIKRPGDSLTSPSFYGHGYVQSYGLSLCIQDANGDGREDLMLMGNAPGGLSIYTLYLQQTNGLFYLEPALTYTNREDWHTTFAWYDINHDGRLDLIKSTISDEPSFVPGLQSGKVLVAAYLADQTGRVPANPQQVFRKADWSAFLPMVDVDGDGFMDLVLGYIPLDSRDGMRDIITSGRFNLDLKFHFFQPGAGFSPEPEFQRKVPVYFGNDLIWTSETRIYSEKFLSLNGDFNGDGKKDLLVRDHGHEISVYFFNSRKDGFSEHADMTFPCPESLDSWRIEDLNHDGVSDLVIKVREPMAYHIFLSHGK